MSKFHTLKVKDVRRETSNSVSVALEIPDALKNDFNYKAGQYLTVRININGEDVRRSYSLCSSPDVNEDLRIAVKIVPNGKMSTYINQNLKTGGYIESMSPEGNFILKNGVESKHYIGFAAGSGITPIISIIKSVLSKNTESRFTLFYGNKSESDTIFKAELDSLVLQYSRLRVVYLYSRENKGEELLQGRLMGEKVSPLMANYCANSENKEFFLCGPEEMIKQVSDKLVSMGVDKERIHFELFTTPVSLGNTDIPVNNFEGISDVTIVMDDESYSFQLNSKGISILDAAMNSGADAPFSCKGAVCCTCKAKVVEGTAIMDMNYALSDKEVQDGYILTCQSHPASAKLVVSFDEP
ncbi:MAG: FAD-binding oxidoreductase [Flavobacteriales bacterium]